MSLVNTYQKAITEGLIEPNPRQQETVLLLDQLTEQLTTPRSFWKRFKRKEPIKGVYLFGEVGVGKTFIMDLFYNNLPLQLKQRFHFHHFMQEVDAQLRLLQGQKNPLKLIAARLADSAKVLCFDEFLVNDVAHAMILAELLTCLYDAGLTLVVTSNTLPDELYKNGVHRIRFLPAIALLKSHCSLVHLRADKDYRLGRTKRLTAYIYPLTPENARLFAEQFAMVAPTAPATEGQLMIQNRALAYIRCDFKTLWVDFSVICQLPRSQLDYLEIAERFSQVFISNIPILTSTASVILFIYLVDIFYDSGIELIISAALPLEMLYVDGEMKREFQRTLSRLQEMQSVDYTRRHPLKPINHM